MNRHPCRAWNAFVLTLCIASLTTQQILAANPAVRGPSPAAPQNAAETVAVRDIALAPGGVLRGQVVDAQGVPSSKSEVQVFKMSNQQPTPTLTRTDEQGRFEVAGLSGGIYRVDTAKGIAFYRLWTPQTAPPAAKPAALIVEGDPAVRANLGRIGWLGWTLIGLGVGTAIVLPLVLDDDDDDGS